MKTTFIAIAVMTAAVIAPLNASAWGRLGHATIAEIAERHLTPKARANIERYTGGTPLAEYGSWLDVAAKEEPFKTNYEGFHASIADQDCNSPLYIRKHFRGCKDGVTAMEFYREYLRDYKSIDDSLVLEAIKCMVHVVGDFHCPAHVRFTDCRNDGKFPITYEGKEVRYHDFWDSGLIQRASGLGAKDWKEYADRLDVWNSRRIRKVSGGWAREWFEDAARDIRPIIHEVKKGDTLDRSFIDSHIGLAEDQIRKAGYQLAAALNTIFGK